MFFICLLLIAVFGFLEVLGVFFSFVNFENVFRIIIPNIGGSVFYNFEIFCAPYMYLGILDFLLLLNAVCIDCPDLLLIKHIK